MAVVETDPGKMIFIFEEAHVSPAGQIEIAIMLNRLYEDCDLRFIGLEGAFAAEGVLDATWFHFPPPFRARDPIRAREDIIVQLLEDGEINSAEMMTLIYTAATVAGIDDADKYNYVPPDEAWIANTWYLFQIAAPGMTPSEISEFNRLVEEAQGLLNDDKTVEASNKLMEAIDFAVNTDEWTREKHTLLSDETIIISCKQYIQIMEDIETKAIEANAEIEPEDEGNFRALKMFFEACSMRSATMVTSTLGLLEQSAGTPVAMTVGAAHTEEITELLAGDGVSFAVIRPISLEENRKEGNLHDQAYERKLSAQSVDPAGTLGALLDSRRKPRRVIEEIWFKSKASIFLLADHLARAVAAGEAPPFTNLLDNLSLHQRVTLDRNSIRVDGDDVIFSVSAPDQNGKQVTIWVRAYVDRERVAKLLEERLFESLARLQDEDEPSPDPEPESSRPVLTPITPETLAWFAASEAEIDAVRER